MNPLLNVDIGFYFEVKNSEMFGGEGSIGYTAIKLDGVKNIESVSNNEFIDEKIQSIAAILNVSKDEVRLVSKEEYEEETDDDYLDDLDGEYDG